jgi:uncharacterized membrane protein YdjX (TVP38/TMEM64 family)
LLLIGGYVVAAIVMFPRLLVTLAAVVVFGPWLAFAYYEDQTGYCFG